VSIGGLAQGREITPGTQCFEKQKKLRCEGEKIRGGESHKHELEYGKDVGSERKNKYLTEKWKHTYWRVEELDRRVRHGKKKGVAMSNDGKETLENSG